MSGNVARCAALVVGIALVVLAAPAVCGAAPVLLDFESGAGGGEQVTNQYGPPGTPAGPSFFPGTNAGFAGLGCGGPHVLSDASQAYGGSRSLILDGCPGGEFWPTATFFALGYSTRSVSFQVGRSTGTGPVCCTEIWTTAFRGDGSIVQQQQTLLLPNQTANASYKGVALISSQDDIAFVAVEAGTKLSPSGSATGVNLGVGNQHLLIDDIVYEPPSSPPNSSFKLGSAPASTRVSAGAQSPQITIPVTWTNNPSPASSPVSFELSAPAGITGSFSVNPSAAGSTKLTLDVAKSAAPGMRSVTVTGYVDKGQPSEKSASVAIPVEITIPFVATPPGDIDVAPCTPADRQIRVATDPTFPQQIEIAVSTSAPGIRMTAVDGQPIAPTTALTRTRSQQNGEATMIVRFETEPGAAPTNRSALNVVAMSPGYASQKAVGSVGIGAGAVTRVLPAGGGFDVVAAQQPLFLRQPSRLELRGSGFCPGSLVRFGDAGATAVPESIAPGGSALTVSTPRGALSGPVRVIRPSGHATAPGPSLSIAGVRERFGFSFPNFGSPDNFRFDQFVSVFGDSMFLKIDPCDLIPFTFGLVDCPVTTGIPDPIAAIIHVALQGRGKLGLCYGFSRLSGQFMQFQSWSSYPAPGSPFPNALAPAPGSKPLLEDLELAYLRQFSVPVLNASAGQVLSASGQSGPVRAALLRSRVEQELLNGGGIFGGRPVMISMRADGSGHVVLAYDVVDTGGGRFDILVYDSNVPFDSAEAGNPDLHAARMGLGRISVDPASDRWQFTALKASKGGPWEGPIDGKAIFVIPGDIAYDTGKTQLVGLGQLPQLVIIASTGARLDQVQDAQGRTLLEADGDPARGARAIPRAAALPPTDARDGANPIAVIPAGGTYEVRAARGGAGRLTAVARGLVASAAVTGARGAGTGGSAADVLRLAEGGRDVAFAPGGGGALTLNLAAGRGEAAHSVALAGAASAGMRDRLMLRDGGLTVEHRGPAATRTLTLAAGGVAVSVPLGRLRSGQRATVRVGSWRRLGAARVRIGSRAPRVRASRARLLRSPRLTVRRTSGRRIVVRAALRRRGSQRLLGAGATVAVLRAGRVLVRRTLKLTGADLTRRSVPLRWTSRRLPAGRLRVVLVTTASAAGRDGIARTDVRAVRRGVS